MVQLRDRLRLPAAQAGAALALGVCLQVIGSAPTFESLVPRWWQAPLVAVSVGNAVLFWIFVQALFDDEFQFRPGHLAAWLAVALLSGWNCATAAGAGSAFGLVTVGLQRAVPLVFATLAALAAMASWRSDLVEKRRRFRAFIVLSGIVFTVAELLVRLASPGGRLLGMSATLDVAALLCIVGVVAVRMLSLTGSELFPSESRVGVTIRRADAVEEWRPAPVPVGEALPPADPGEERLAESLQRLMRGERVYRAEGLTVAGLAQRLAVPEYRLRRLINRRLGYRNFNAFVNGYRLDEARAALADPVRRELPVLTIALDAGFQSIGPFNRAFKASTGLTPTEFRRLNMAES